MRVIKDIKEMQQISSSLHQEGKIIGLVPTMGFLHDGHLSLIKQSKQKADVTVVSIYVNPTQFAPNEDLDQYPRDFERDENLCKKLGVDFIFYPSNKSMYGENFHTFVITEQLSEKLCGLSRPTHFRGVTTIVAKLFNIVKPHFAIFGQKDAQQSIIIKRMVTDLNFDLEVIIAPIIREKDGLAMSSRNKYLSLDQRENASIIYGSLMLAKEMVKNGEKNSSKIKGAMQQKLQSVADLQIDYISIVDMQNFDPVEKVKSKTLIAIAAFLGSTRLIDNIIID